MRFAYFAIFLASVTTLAQQPPDQLSAPSDSFQVTGRVAGLSPIDGLQPVLIDLVNASDKNICLGIYVYEDYPGVQHQVACCSKLMEPKKPYVLSSGSPRLLIQPTYARIKLMATTPFDSASGPTCNAASDLTHDRLAPGLLASISDVGIPLSQPAPSCIVMGTNTPCIPELLYQRLACTFISSSGSGYQICSGPVPSQLSAEKKGESVTVFFHRASRIGSAPGRPDPGTDQLQAIGK